jgi:hypothetical protein
MAVKRRSFICMVLAAFVVPFRPKLDPRLSPELLKLLDSVAWYESGSDMRVRYRHTLYSGNYVVRSGIDHIVS